MESQEQRRGRREFIKKAAYSAPMLIALGSVAQTSLGAASCEVQPMGCPPDPPTPESMFND